MARRSRQESLFQTDHKRFFSDKEHEIVEKELRDKDAAARNLPVLRELLLTSPSMRNLLFKPFQMLTVMQALEGQLRTQSTLSGQQVDQEAYYNQVIEQVAPYLEPQPMIEFFREVAKRSRIKREKRVLLWALAEVLMTLSSRRPVHESQVVRLLVVTSMGNAIDIMEKVGTFLGGKEPYEFSWEKLVNNEYTDDQWRTLFQETRAIREEFLMAVSLNAMDLFEHASKPFGLRFYRILHYPAAAKGPARKLVVLPGETEPPREESEEARQERLAEAMNLDLSMGYMSEMAPEVVESIRAASFGDMADEQRTILLNAAAFATFYPAAWSPFLQRLYQESGENAESINPDDEADCIRDMKADPGNPDLYKRYADVLFDKDELAGAYNTYRHVLQLRGEGDETITGRMREIQERLASRQAQQAAEQAGEAAAE